MGRGQGVLQVEEDEGAGGCGAVKSYGGGVVLRRIGWPKEAVKGRWCPQSHEAASTTLRATWRK